MTMLRRVLISGASGLIGSALVPALQAQGHTVVRLVRARGQQARESVFWESQTGRLDGDALAGVDSVVHLAAHSIAAGRWNEKQKRKIWDSRVTGTRLLCETLTALPKPPDVLVCASAMGYYGDRGDELLTEDSPMGKGFLCEVVRAWEEATTPVLQSGIRVVNLRFGVVLDPKGGSLAELLPIFRIGFGGPLAGGHQYFSWISLKDTVDAILFALDTSGLSGPVNVVSPNPVREMEFARVLGRLTSRPVWFNVPRFVLRMRLGKEFADSILASQQINPAKLIAAGFRFRHPDVETALRELLGKRISST